MLKIRPASRSDAQLLFDWRNDPSTRRMFRTADDVSWTDHLAWLDRRLADAEPHLYMAEIDGGVAVGTIRVDAGRLSYIVGPAFRGRGYASEMLIWARDRYGVLVAEIRPDNVASLRAASRAGHTIVLL